MKKDFLTQLNEKVKEARSKADNPNQTRKLIEKAKEYCIKNIQINWLNSIPDVLEADGMLIITASVIFGKKGLYSYGFDLPNDKEVILSSRSEAAGIIKEIVDELSQIIEREVEYEVHHDRSSYWSLKVSFFY